MTAPRVVVVRSRFGGVFAEIAGWLAEAMGAAVCLSEAQEIDRADGLVLVGGGIEFEQVLGRRWPGRRPAVALWAFDPFPPQGLSAGDVTRGLRRARWAGRGRRLDARLGHPFGGPGERGLAKRTLRALAMRTSRGDADLDAAIGAAGDPRLAIFNFERLAAVERLVARGWIDHVLVSSPAAARTLAARGIEAQYQPVCRHRDMGRDLGRSRDIPVLFLGTVKDHRAVRLQRLAGALAARNVPLTIVDRACFGEDRTTLLNRARIVVNLHQYPWHLERIRMFLAMANGALLVSERPVADPEPFEVGTHLLAADTEGLADAIAGVLADAGRWTATTEAARRQFAAQPDYTALASHLQRLLATA